MNFIRKTLITFTVIFSMLFVTSSFAKSNEEVRILNVLLDLPRFAAQDKEEPIESRIERFEKLSLALNKAADKRPAGVSKRKMISALITIAYKETRLAKNVSLGRCDLMPEGQQCDSGRAKTYFQLWQVACPDVWEESLEPGSQEELDIAAYCAARLMTAAYNRCAGKNEHGIWAGAYSGYRSENCNWNHPKEHRGPDVRANYMNMIYYKLSQVPTNDNEKSAKNKKSKSKSI